MKRVHVSGLGYATGNCGLLRALGQLCGQVVDVFVSRQEQGDPLCKGYGFLTFENDEQADNAVQILNGLIFQGRALKANITSPHEGRFNLALDENPLREGSNILTLRLCKAQIAPNFDLSMAAEVPATVVDFIGDWGTPEFRYVVEVLSNDGKDVCELELSPNAVFYKKTPFRR